MVCEPVRRVMWWVRGIAEGSVASLLNHSARRKFATDMVIKQNVQLNIVISMGRHRDKR